MQTLEALQKKIQSAEDLHSVVRTMKSLAAVNIRHYEKAVESVENYYRSVELGFQVVLNKGPVELLPATAPASGALCAVVYGSDQGLTGGFNERIASHAAEALDAEQNGREDLIICIGARVYNLMKDQGRSAEKLFPVPGSLRGVTPILGEIVMLLNTWQEEGKIGRITLFHNSVISRAAYEPQTVHLLPLGREWFEKTAKEEWPCRNIPTFTMDRSKLFSSLIRQFIFVSLYRAYAQSMASENASRLASMQAAEKNINERLEELRAKFRQQRQDAITSELLDIISGFEALQQGR